MTSAQIVPALVVPLVAWRVYSRVRRTIGRQPLHAKRLGVTIAILCIVTGLIGAAAARVPAALGGLAGGLLIAAVLASIGYRLTKFEFTSQGKSYTPNAIIGVAVTLLFIARLAYRMIVIVGSPAAAGSTPAASFTNTLTLLFVGITAGYYIFYYAAVLWRCRQSRADGPSP